MCENSETKTHLEMYFTVNLAFIDYFTINNRRIRNPYFKELDNPRTNSTTFNRNV